jgi:uncharacterized protein YbjT (DUF2867 family)
MSSYTKVAVAGATGRAGRHVVDVLRADGHDVVEMSRTTGVDVITGEGLAEALAGVQAIIDVATGPSPEQAAATEFFETSARNLQRFGEQAGVERIVVASIIGADKFPAGYNVSKVAHERALQSGPVPVRVLRAAQFHELVGLMLDWTTQGEVAYMPKMRTQPLAARSVAEELARLALDADATPADGALMWEVAGPREESMVEIARALAARRGTPSRVEGVSDPDIGEQYESGAHLPGPNAKLTGPTFAEWLQTAA